MPLHLQLKADLSLPVDAGSLLPERIAALDTNKVAQLPLRIGNQIVSCGDLFHITGSAFKDETLIFEGNCHRLRSVGTMMSSGRIQVVGSVGMHLGHRMSGGEIHIEGNALDWAGAEMAGGQIRIEGDAGNYLGAAYPGSSRGMSGGEIFVHGSVGTFSGSRMRRGLIVVSQNAGEAAGAGLIAGSLCLLGTAGASLAAGMKRGTILVGHAVASSNLPSTFSRVGQFRPVFLNLLLKKLVQHGFSIPATWSTELFDCYRGDSLELGLGEVYFPRAL